MWTPTEIILHEKVIKDPVTASIINQCDKAPIRVVETGLPKDIVAASEILSGLKNQADPTMLDVIIGGKKVLYVAPYSQSVVDEFLMPDDRLKCPHFERVKFASNGCFYQCDWCYLKGTYRGMFPYITVYAEYDKIKKRLHDRLQKTNDIIMFNSGELADSLSLDHLTHAGREFIPWFGQSENGYLFMLTKSDNVDDILDLPHNQHTVVAWSMNNAEVSQRFEIGAPPLHRRLAAARKVQEAGYPVRIRLDPIVPFAGWQEAYTQTIAEIFDNVNPDRITIGTLRFEKQFYNMRHSILTTKEFLLPLFDQMVPMFEPETITVDGKSKKSVGKYSFPEEMRIDIFNFIIPEIRNYSDCHIALCKESSDVWQKTGLDLSQNGCVCQYGFVDMT